MRNQVLGEPAARVPADADEHARGERALGEILAVARYAGGAAFAHRPDAARITVQRRDCGDQVALFSRVFTSEPTSTTSPQNSWPGTQGNEVKGIAVGESFMNMRLMSLPHTPQSLVFIFTHSGEGRDGSGMSASFMVENGPR